ncbi:hypothetical protein ACFOUV_16900 [Oceanobacillus longus]|uniref:Viral A-type inclusion protein n=1 Tax=Oceanobacillus longus TaxID=930120 RepID=A0ABV8H3Q0_9BACI
MSKDIDINIWKFLINRLDERQKKEVLTRKNVRIGNMQSQLINKESQWKIVLNLLNNSLNKTNIQKAIVAYYVETLIPDLNIDMNNKASHLHALDNIEKGKYEEKIKEHGFLYILLYFVSKNNSRANEVINLQPEEVIKEIAIDPYQAKLAKALEEIRDFKKEISTITKAHKGLQKKFDTLETKYNQMTTQYTNEIKKLEDSYIKDMEESSDLLDFERIEFKEKLLLLNDKNTILQNQLVELQKDKNEKTEINNMDDKKILSKTSVIENKRKKIRVLVFGDLPLNAQKTDTHEFEYFNKDISTYMFNEDYEEYWCVEDKLSAKEKKQLQRNPYSNKVNIDKKNYSKLVH